MYQNLMFQEASIAVSAKNNKQVFTPGATTEEPIIFQDAYHMHTLGRTVSEAYKNREGLPICILGIFTLGFCLLREALLRAGVADCNLAIHPCRFRTAIFDVSPNLYPPF